jgi:type I restriction enzyme S subunit
MGKWKEIRVSEIGPVFSGSTPSTSSPEFWDGEYVWITPADLSMVDIPFVNSSSRKLTWLGVKKATNGLLPENCVIISCRAPVGYCAVVSCDFSFNQGCKAIMSYEKYDSLYLYYYLKMYKRSLERVSSGTTFLELPKRELGRFKINIPLDTKEQSKIAEILSTIDIVVEKTKAIVEKCKRIKTGMMQDLLANGIDEKGNIRSPKTHNYKDSPIGKIPVEWECQHIKTIASVCMGQSPNGKTINQDKLGMPFLQGNAEFGNYHPSECFWCEKPLKCANKEDVLLSVRAPVGEINYADKEYCIGRGLASIRFYAINSVFAFYECISEVWQLYKSCQGTTFLAVSKNDIGDLLLKYPKDIKEQSDIVDRIITIDTEIQSEQAYLEKLQRIKQGLMQDLLTHTVAVDMLL